MMINGKKMKKELKQVNTIFNNEPKIIAPFARYNNFIVSI